MSAPRRPNRLTQAPEVTEAVLQAAASGDAEALAALLDAGASPDTSARDGEPALHLAARLEKPATVDLLLQRGADLHDTGPFGTVLHCLAAYPKMLALLDRALAMGAAVDARDPSDRTPLVTAVRREHVVAARRLLAAGADPHVVSRSGSNLLLHMVTGVGTFDARRDHGEALRLMRDLLLLGVDPQAPGEAGQTAVTAAAERGLRGVLDLFAEHDVPADSHDERGYSAVQAAAMRGESATARALVGRGAPVDIHTAASLGDVERVRELLQADPSLANEVHTGQRSAPLGGAILNGHLEAALLLLEHGADPNGPVPMGHALSSAMRHLPDAGLVHALIAHGADLNHRDGDSNTPLNFAARHDRLELARILLDAGADPTIATERGYPPIEFATSDAMRALLRSRGGDASGNR